MGGKSSKLILIIVLQVRFAIVRCGIPHRCCAEGLIGFCRFNLDKFDFYHLGYKPPVGTNYYNAIHKRRQRTKYYILHSSESSGLSNSRFKTSISSFCNGLRLHGSTSLSPLINFPWTYFSKTNSFLDLVWDTPSNESYDFFSRPSCASAKLIIPPQYLESTRCRGRRTLRFEDFQLPSSEDLLDAIPENAWRSRELVISPRWHGGILRDMCAGKFSSWALAHLQSQPKCPVHSRGRDTVYTRTILKKYLRELMTDHSYTCNPHNVYH